MLTGSPQILRTPRHSAYCDAGHVDISLGKVYGAAMSNDTEVTSNATCSWFLLCENPATRLREHPILGGVPICERCDDKVEKLER